MTAIGTGFMKCEWCGRHSAGALLCDVCERWKPWLLQVTGLAAFDIEHLMRKEDQKRAAKVTSAKEWGR